MAYLKAHSYWQKHQIPRKLLSPLECKCPYLFSVITAHIEGHYRVVVKIEHGLWNQFALVQIPALPLASYVTLGKVLSFLVSCFPYLESVDNTIDLGY